MKKPLLAAMAVMALFLVNTAFADTIYVANLTPDQENPPIEDSDGGGLAVLILSANESKLTTIVSAFNLTTDITMSHIHRAPRGENGPVVHGLTGPKFINPVYDVWDPIPADMVQALKDGNLYVNVHTTNHGGGEIRGQVGPANQ